MVFCGDLIDNYRPNYSEINDDGIVENEVVFAEIKILEFLNVLNDVAESQEGRVIKVTGNHELMNIFGDARYVSPYAHIKKIPYHPEAKTNQFVFSKTIVPDPNAKTEQYNRADFFTPTKPGYDLLMKGTFQLVSAIDNILFVHGGISNSLNDIEIQILALKNKETVNGYGEINQEFTKYLNDLRTKGKRVADNSDLVFKIMWDKHGVTWNRMFGKTETRNTERCTKLETNVQEILGLSKNDSAYLVVAHCGQANNFNKQCSTNSKEGGWFFHKKSGEHFMQPNEKMEYEFDAKLETEPDILYYEADVEAKGNVKGFVFHKSNSEMKQENVGVNFGCVNKKVIVVKTDANHARCLQRSVDNLSKQHLPTIVEFNHIDGAYVPKIVKINSYKHNIEYFHKLNEGFVMGSTNTIENTFMN